SGFKSLTQGDRVTFEEGQGPKGPVATDVKKV
ncbi:MAG: cold-shock protein, partial [Deltaproteobacteria bacterium]